MGNVCANAEAAPVVEKAAEATPVATLQTPPTPPPIKEEVKKEEPPVPAPAPVPAEPQAVLTFKDVTTGQETDIVFKKGPLGMRYKTNVTPVIIVGFPPNSNAQSLGVKEGTQLVKVNGVDHSSSSWKTIDDAVKEAAGKLNK